MLSTSIKTLRLLLPIWLACLGVWGVCSSGLGRADDGSRDNIHGDMILMQGKWNLVDFVYYRDNLAQRIPKAQRRGTRIVNGNRYRLKLTIGMQQVDDDYSFRIYPKEKPKAFDVTLPDGQTVIKGIYEINADTLRRAYVQEGQPRPTQFQTGDQTYQVWKRAIDPPLKQTGKTPQPDA